MKRLPLACLLLLLAAGVTACIPERDPSQDEDAATETRIQNVGPEFTRDDAAVVFSSDRAGNGDVYRVSISSDTSVVRLSNYPSDEWTTRGSAASDGLLLVESNSSGYFAVYKFNPASATYTPFLYAQSVHYRSASWSPDGTRIVYSRATAGGYYKVWVAAADGSGARQLTTGAGQDFKPSMSAAGRIVFQRILNGQSDLCVIDDPAAANVIVRNLSATGEVDEYDPVFASDEERVFFVQGRLEGEGRISSVMADGSGGAVLISAAGHYSDLALSHNGQRLAYAYRPNADADRDIYLATRDGGVLVKRLTRGALGPAE